MATCIVWIHEGLTPEGWTHRAWCGACPWSGPVRDTIEEAEADRTEHQARKLQLVMEF